MDRMEASQAMNTGGTAVSSADAYVCTVHTFIYVHNAVLYIYKVNTLIT